MPISKVPDLPDTIAIVDPDTGYPTQLFQRWWQNSIEAAINSLVGVANAQEAADAANRAAIAAKAAALAANSAATGASTAAATAQTSANNAQAAATAATRESSLSNSYVTGLTITSADAGVDANVIISSHTRRYGDGTSVAVTGNTLTGLPYGTQLRIYYDQASRAGGVVAYQTTPSITNAAQTGDRHSVGVVTTALAAGALSNGNALLPPGYALNL